jgi:hypothetical protein
MRYRCLRAEQATIKFSPRWIDSTMLAWMVASQGRTVGVGERNPARHVVDVRLWCSESPSINVQLSWSASRNSSAGIN